MSTKICPACGSEHIETKKSLQFFHDFFAGSVEVEVTEDECLVCGADGDFESVNDEETKHALETIKKNGAKNIINGFSSHGFNLAAIERALELPQRTLSKWRNDSAPTAAGLSLLKFISIFPWLINVADTNFNFEQSQEICAHAAVKYLCEKKTEINSNISSRLSYGTAVVNITQVAIFENHFHPAPFNPIHTSGLIVTV